MTFDQWWQEQGSALESRALAQHVWDAAITIEREQCARVVETKTLTLGDHMYPSPGERHLIAVTEAGCRGAFADAIRDRSSP